MKYLIAFLSILFTGTLQSQHYTYDSFNRLIEVTYPSGQTIRYTYDRLGNRIGYEVLSTESGCGTPESLGNNNLMPTTADLHWAPVTGAEFYVIEWRLKGTTFWYQATATDPLYTIQDLLPASVYEWKVKTECTETGSDWSLIQEFTTGPDPGLTCRYIDSLVLVVLYHATNGPTWTETWDLNQPMDSWKGVSVTPEGCVDGIALNNKQLDGVLPNEIGRLNSLVYLHITTNPLLSGAIPETITQLPNLERLHLYNNQLEGTIPEGIINLQRLVSFDLSGNQLEGTISSDFCELPELRWLILHHNQFTGAIPANWKPFSILRYLSLSHNQLSGTLPISLNNLTELLRLYLQNNQLEGCFPEGLEQFCDLGFSTNLEQYGYNFTNNPALPGGGDFSAFCSAGTGSCGGNCSDGIQNGDETGIDCGGSLCPPCENGCPDLVFESVSIDLDNNRFVVVIKNIGTEAVDFNQTPVTLQTNLSADSILNLGDVGGGFANFPSGNVDQLAPGASFSWTFGAPIGQDTCLRPIALLFLDYENGLVECDESNNTYVIQTIICGCMDPTAPNYNPAAMADDGSCQNCSDGIQNGDETGIDCGGTFCSPCSCELLASWYQGPLGTANGFPSIEAADINAGNLTFGPGVNTIQYLQFGNPPPSFSLSSVASPSLDEDDYYSISLSTLSGAEVKIENLEFDVQRGNGSNIGADQWVVKSSIDGFNSILASGTISSLGVWEAISVSLEDLNLVSNAIEFRIYVYGAANNSGRIYFDNIEVCGQRTECVEIFAVNNIPIPANTYHAGLQLTSSGRVNANTTVIFKAGTSILLQPGFTAEAGSDFQALIEVCQPTNSISLPGIEDSRAKTVVRSSELEIRLFPNPASHQLNIKYYLPKATSVEIIISNINGRFLSTPFSAERQSTGTYILRWTLQDLVPGVYYVTIRTDEGIETEKVVVAR